MFAIEYSQTQEFGGTHFYTIRGLVYGFFDTEAEAVEAITDYIQKKAKAIKWDVERVAVVGDNYFEWETTGIYIREQLDVIEIMEI